MASKDTNKTNTNSLFAWLTPSDSHVQMNPLAALSKSEALKKLTLPTVGLAVLAVLGFMLLQSVSTPQTSSVNANVNLKKSLVGTIESVQMTDHSFVLTFGSSIDEEIHTSGVTHWLVRFLPGTDMQRSTSKGMCFTLPDVTQYAAKVTPANCTEVLVVGKRVLVEYVVLRKSNGSMIARVVIGEK